MRNMRLMNSVKCLRLGPKYSSPQSSMSTTIRRSQNNIHTRSPQISSSSLPSPSTEYSCRWNLSRRFMGGGGGNKQGHAAEHHHEHHLYPPEPQSMQARLWEGHSTEPEGWETSVYLTYAAATVLLGLTLGFAPDTKIRSWAEGEARARLSMLADGTIDKVEFGKHYNTPQMKFQWESKVVDDPFDEDEEEEEGGGGADVDDDSEVDEDEEEDSD